MRKNGKVGEHDLYLTPEELLRRTKPGTRLATVTGGDEATYGLEWLSINETTKVEGDKITLRAWDPQKGGYGDEHTYTAEDLANLGYLHEDDFDRVDLGD